MKLKINDKITAMTVQGDTITGTVTAILENTVILYCGLTNHVVSKKELEKEGYKFEKIAKRTKTIVVSSNRNLKD